MNGTGNLAAAFMPTLMGGVIGVVSDGSGGSISSFFAGFALLVGTQGVVFACGYVLWLRERLDFRHGQAITSVA